MKFFVDTADVAAISELNDLGMVDGVTTNPSLILKSGRDIIEVTREIAGYLAILASSLEDAGHQPRLVAEFLTRCLFCMFAEDVGLLPGRLFDAVVVTNYLHRPLFGSLLAALAPGGVLIYETFAVGNGRFGKPSNPAFLLEPGELLARCRELRVVAFEDGLVALPGPAAVQRICAFRPVPDADAIARHAL